MSLNQAAHGDREFGFIGSRLRIDRKVVVGHWQDDDVQAKLGSWARVAAAWADWQGAKLARFGDNMRDVAVTEGDKVQAQIQLGYDVYGYGVGDLVKAVNEASDADVAKMVKTYLDEYEVSPALKPGGEKHESLREGARIEVGMRNFLEAGNFKAFTTTFEDLHGLAQLPGLAVQRLMRDGYGFGARRRLENLRPCPRDEGDERRLEGRRQFYGRLHLPFQRQRRQSPRRAHARNLRVDCREQAQTGNPPAFDWRQG
jgi:L-arabinose isomerase